MGWTLGGPHWSLLVVQPVVGVHYLKWDLQLTSPLRIAGDLCRLGGLTGQPVFVLPGSNSAGHLVGTRSDCVGWTGAIHAFVEDTLHLAHHQRSVANLIRHRLTSGPIGTL